MKCPHCEYVRGSDAETMTYAEGKFGEFWVGPSVGRDPGIGHAMTEHTCVYACPKCQRLFIQC